MSLLYSRNLLSPIKKDLEKMRSSLRPTLENYNTSLDIIRGSALTTLKSLESDHSKFLKELSPAMTGLNNYSKYFSTAFSGLDTLKRQGRIWEQLSLSLEMATHQRERIKNLGKMFNWNSQVIDSARLSKFTLSMESIFAEESIRKIDLSGLDQLNDVAGSTGSDLNIDITARSGGEVTAAVDTPKKKLADMTEDDLKKIILNSLTSYGAFSIVKFIYNLYADYVNDAAKVLLEVVFAFVITHVTGHYNAEVKHEIYETIQESKTVTDSRKVITKYVKVNPTDQVAFLRTETFLRGGDSKKSLVVLKEKITTKTVLTILERKNNWLKVEIYSGDFAGETGWIEESKVIKFKKVK